MMFSVGATKRETQLIEKLNSKAYIYIYIHIKNVVEYSGIYCEKHCMFSLFVSFMMNGKSVRIHCRILKNYIEAH